jgi:hypothetical protein
MRLVVIIVTHLQQLTQGVTMSDDDKKLEMPYLAILPYQVLVDKLLPPACKIHFAIVCGLSKKFGYCYASDKQLAELQEVSIPTIESWNLFLEKSGHIIRKTINIFIPESKRGDSKQSFRKSRKIYINNAFVSKEDCETLENKGSHGTLDFKGSEEPLENKGYKNKPLSTNNNNNSSDPVVVVFSVDEDEKRKILQEFAFDSNTLTHLCSFSLQVISQALEAYRSQPPGKIANKEGYMRNAIQNGWKVEKKYSEEDKKTDLIKKIVERKEKCLELYINHKQYIAFKGVMDFKICDDGYEMRKDGNIVRIAFTEDNCVFYLLQYIDHAMKIIKGNDANNL